ncbi:putative integral membrane protein [Virgibacillus natechei]|uniref:Integral membrane protein n=1 Tax=Virgibacillus natechei TaxID=1216297 RepID=A0ABS4ICV2_9BACI|nr:lipopolysaccharide assembly protein LapA domain-containing protein [Virgibacillus natechei]MBP1968772.1 putative integral membrane protein [Virgibacillus natechei]UZD11572.1 lipopolysaccharide assembly protein LapA domain-containing protein [Virgibacillus natechei]
MRGQSYVILAIIFVIIIAVFAVTNVDPVEVNYLFWSGESPLILIILFSVLMGGIITASVGVLKMYQLQREVKKLQVENKKMSTKLQENDLLEIDPEEDSSNEKNENNKK